MANSKRLVPRLVLVLKRRRSGGAPRSRRGSASFEIVLNSGLTFREAHDRTHSLQNPKLPDWAVLDLRQPPSAESAGRIADAGFFDDFWQVRKVKE